MAESVQEPIPRGTLLSPRLRSGLVGRLLFLRNLERENILMIAQIQMSVRNHRMRPGFGLGAGRAIGRDIRSQWKFERAFEREFLRVRWDQRDLAVVGIQNEHPIRGGDGAARAGKVIALGPLLIARFQVLADPHLRFRMPVYAAIDEDDAGSVTDFLVAPLQPKGAESGSAKSLVDFACRERESQETRRLLYVAATRAREELHLFARPEFKIANDQSLALVPPRGSLLATAWPGLRNEVQRRFEEWCAEKSAQAAQTDEQHTIETLAASAENVLVLPAPLDALAPKPTLLRRLPSSFEPSSAELPFAADEPQAGAGRLYERHEGGLISRALGKAVHELFQHLAPLFATETSEVARESLVRLQPRIAANIRAFGIDAGQANRIAAEALEMVLRAARDPQAQWILAAHAEAASEARWTGVVAGSLRTVQVDRVFRAGPMPQSTGDCSTWWIVDYKTGDYKTAHEDGLDAKAVLAELRGEFAPQIEAYAKVLRNLHGADAVVRGGLYYPRMALFDWWEL